MYPYVYKRETPDIENCRRMLLKKEEESWNLSNLFWFCFVFGVSQTDQQLGGRNVVHWCWMTPDELISEQFCHLGAAWYPRTLLSVLQLHILNTKLHVSLSG